MSQNSDTKVVIPVSIKTPLGVDTDTNGKTASRKTRRRKFNRATRTVLPILVAVKDRVRSRWSKIPYARQCEFEAVLELSDELLNAVLDNRDMPDSRADAMLGAIVAFVDSTYWQEQRHGWEDE